MKTTDNTRIDGIRINHIDFKRDLTSREQQQFTQQVIDAGRCLRVVVSALTDTIQQSQRNWDKYASQLIDGQGNHPLIEKLHSQLEHITSEYNRLCTTELGVETLLDYCSATVFRSCVVEPRELERRWHSLCRFLSSLSRCYTFFNSHI